MKRKTQVLWFVGTIATIVMTVVAINAASITSQAGDLYVEGDLGVGTTSTTYRADIVGDPATDNVFRIRAGSNEELMRFTGDPDEGDLEIFLGDIGQVDGSTLLTIDDADAQIRLGSGGLDTLIIDSNDLVVMPETYSQSVSSSPRDLYIDDNGVLGFQSSASRYKKNVNDMGDTSWVHELRPVTFNYKDDRNNETHYGLIAEEVEGVNPDFVFYNESGSVEGVHYDRMIAVLIAELQRQNEIIEELQDDDDD